MARMRHLLLTLASGSAFYSGLVPALGLGEISLHSALNQPLDAEIELLQASDLSADDVKVRLASAEEFNRAGVERFYFLNDLRFTPVLSGGRHLIRVVSSKPVREPYLNFIVEVSRPGGQLLREFTLLIDPPGSAASSSNATVYAPPALQAQPVRQPAWQPAPAQKLPVANRGERYRVQRGDSLWNIAGRLLPPGGSREALMTDIFTLNPQAFSGGSPDRLRAGAELLLPDALSGSSAAPATVVPEVAPVVNESAPATAAHDMAPAQASTTAEAAPVLLDAPADMAPEAQPMQALEAQQAQVDSELAEVSSRNQELQSALGSLQDQMAQLQAQMAEKDRQLQQIRTELQQRQVAPPPVVSEPVVAPVTSEQGDSWTWWLLGGVLSLSLLVGVLLAKRRQAPPVAEPPRRMPTPAPRSSVRVVPRPQASVERAPAVPVAPAAPAAMAAPRQPAVVADPLEGANIYIAYGQFTDAASALRQAVEKQPERLDLRLRLLEVYGALSDSSAFFELEQQLREMGASPVQLDQIRTRYAGLQRPQGALLEDTLLQSDEAESTAPALLQDDFQLNLDDLSLDTDWALDSTFQPDQPARLRNAQEEAQFQSDLEQLPEVLEMDADKEMLESFAELPQEQVLGDELTEAFSRESVVTTIKPRLLDTDLDRLGGNREHLAKLNMALAYIEQGDIGSACDILNEVISSGDEQQRQRARELLARIA